MSKTRGQACAPFPASSAATFCAPAALRSATPTFLAAYPNAGIPKIVGDKTIYDLTPEAMAAAFPAILDAGARIVGACCGSTPAHIKAIAGVVKGGRGGM